MPQVVLLAPEIPPNTGNVARTCAATGTALHLIDPLGFEINDRQLKRAGLDYWPHVQLHRHGDWSAFQALRCPQGGKLVGLSRHASISYLDYSFQSEDWLLFGSESSGLPAYALGDCDSVLSVPLPCAAVRSLNLSVAVAVVLFEALRKIQKPVQD
ncbi:MAG: hypothetical protein RLZZ158_44 [Cyanobacteriota bacterium]|jgi:tRNA (cytidine/uridine-2'-O-)-methyltransferase